jgi:hypothetical protein
VRLFKRGWGGGGAITEAEYDVGGGGAANVDENEANTYVFALKGIKWFASKRIYIF